VVAQDRLEEAGDNVPAEVAREVVVGWWRAEAFYDGRPSSCWAAEWEHWVDLDVTLGDSGRQTSQPDQAGYLVPTRPVVACLPRCPPAGLMPPLLDGDAAAVPVLRQLLRADHGSRVRATLPT